MDAASQGSTWPELAMPEHEVLQIGLYESISKRIDRKERYE